MKLFVYLPLALHWNIEDVLQISYGVGNTAEAVVSLDSMKRFDVVDISANILEMSEIIHSATGVYPLRDERTQAHVEDGRFYLQTTDRKYDLITGEPPPPKMAGISNLYTQEYFELLKSRLKPGGMTSYWLPVHNLYDADAKAIIKVFCLAFPDCSLWNGSGLDFIMLGSKDGIGKIFPSKLASLWQSPVAEHLKAIGMEKPEQLGSLFLADHQQLKAMTAQVAPVTDEYPQRISPDVGRLFEHSDFYEQLLNTARKKAAWQNSEYIREIFTPKTINNALWYFDNEGMITAYRMNTMGYLPEHSLDIESVNQQMKRSGLQTVPMLWLGLNPVKVDILSRHQQQDSDEYRRDQARLLFAQKQYAEAATAMAEYINNVDPAINVKADYEIMFLAQAMSEGGGNADMADAMEAANMSPHFIGWLKGS